MIPLSGWVLLVSAIITSPTLWSLAEGQMPLHVALTRYLIATAGCWVVLSLLSDVVWPEPASRGATDDEAGSRQPEDAAASRSGDQ